ncbi:DHA2 family lincomycin resistance protein-like MFS transporter [Curtobacterium flaccumfaciens]|nr:MDR family MFS transporter [Curtobacterium flaccumfaciens]MDQ0538364.1 DHA2 family lincomycin resistance protein-like MFS transporter [Curtobacterium flaccumfaciens]
MTAETGPTSTVDADLASTAQRTSDSAELATDERLPKRAKLIIGLLLASTFVVILNETIMGVALPSLIRDLSITAPTAQWLTTAYLLTMAIIIPTTGQVLQRFGTKSVFIAAMTLFTLGTVLAAAAPGFALLLGGRVVQASGTALMIPLLMTTVLTFVPASRRGRMMGLISIVIAVAPAVGPTISGFILNSLSWRWLFIVVLPIALVALVLGSLLITNIAEVRKSRFDVVSILLAALGFGGLIFGLSSLGEATGGEVHLPPVVPVTVGVLALVGFVLRSLSLQKHGRALMDLRPFRTRAFVISTVLVIVSMATLFGSLILLPIYLQDVLGLDTLQTGLTLLPGGVAMGVAAPIVGRLFDRFGPKPLVMPGAVLLSASLWGLTTVNEGTDVALVIAVHVALNIGLGFLLTPLLTSALGSLPKDLYSHGSAIVNTLQQVAGAAGTALFITVMTSGAVASASAGSGAVAAQAAGVHAAFFWGACVSVVPVLLSVFVPRPVSVDRGAMAAH